MHIQRIQEHLLRWVATLFIIVAALFLVKKAADGSTGMVAGAFAGVLITTLLFVMRERIWVLIPIAWPLGGNIPALGLPLTARDILVIAILGIFITLKAFKKITRKVHWDFSATISTVLLLYVASCWIRNPTGFAAIESSRVGGRPYFNILVGLAACWMLRQCSISAKNPSRLAVASLFAGTVEGILGQLIYWFPGIYYVFSQYYDSPGFMWAKSADELETPPGEEGTRRLGFLSSIAMPLSLFVIAAIRPFHKLKDPKLLRLIFYQGLYCVALACAALSGFRSVLGWMILTATTSTFLRHGWPAVFKIFVGGSAALFLLVLGQGTLYNLPYPAHRALSFLPGKWDPQAIYDGAGSTEWRTTMWKELLTTNRYIDNHILGDGFGMKKRDLEVIDFYTRWGDAQQRQETYMIHGGVHSGPVSAIRNIGYVGLAILLTYLIVIAARAFRLALRAKGTPFQTLAFFVCIPAIIEPFYYVAIFGAVENAIPDGLFKIGMLQMLENSMNDAEKAVAEVPDRAPVVSGRRSKEVMASTAMGALRHGVPNEA